jgi:hypothetical protein
MSERSKSDKLLSSGLIQHLRVFYRVISCFFAARLSDGFSSRTARSTDLRRLFMSGCIGGFKVLSYKLDELSRPLV